MKNIFMNIIDVQFGAGAAVLLMIIFRPFLKDRYTASTGRILWLVIVLRLCLPFNPELPSQTFSGVKIPVQDYYIRQRWSREEIQIVPQSRGYKMEILQREDYSIVSTPETDIVSLSDIAFHIWLTGAGIMAAAMPVYAVSYMKTVRNSATDLHITEKLNGQKEKIGIKQNVKVLINNSMSGPVLMGVLRPVIVLPPAERTDSELEMVLIHELVHLRRGDVAFKIFIYFSKCIHWFNPLVWLMAKYAREDIEMACDEAVVRNTDSDYRADYAQSIVSTAMKAQNRYILGTNFTSGGRILKQRFENIFSESSRKNSPAFTVLFSAFVITATVVVGCGQSDDVKVNKSSFPLPEDKVYEILRRQDINWAADNYYPDTAKYISLAVTTNDAAEISTDPEIIEKDVHNTAGILVFSYKPEGEYVSMSNLNISGMDITDTKLKKAVSVLCRLYGATGEETVQADVLAFLQNNGEEYGAWYQNYDDTYVGVWYDGETASQVPEIEITIMDEKYFSIWSANIEKSMYHRSVYSSSAGIVFPRSQLPPETEDVNKVISGSAYNWYVSGRTDYSLSDYKNHYGYYGDIGNTALSVYNISDRQQGRVLDLQVTCGDFGNKITVNFKDKGCEYNSEKLKHSVQSVCRLYNSGIDSENVYSVFMADLQQGVYNLGMGRLTWSRLINGVYYSALLRQDKDGNFVESFSAEDEIYLSNYMAMSEAQAMGVTYTAGETVQDIWDKGE